MNLPNLLWRTYYVLLVSISLDIASARDVRLYGNKTKYGGGVEIYYHFQQTWNPLCGDCWTNNIASVACKELGFRGGIRANRPLGRPGIITAHFDCPSGNEANLSVCAFHDQTPCDRCTEAAGVLCEGAIRPRTFNPPTNTKVVELFWKQRSPGLYIWAFVCGECWTDPNANVTCKQLGYRSGKKGETYRLQDTTMRWIDHYICHGNESELRFCKVAYDSCQSCYTYAGVECDVDGGWGSWGAYGRCTTSCGEGGQVRTRMCDNPIPQSGGLACVGSNRDDRTCNERPCPIAGGWSQWNAYGSCSETCGEGVQALIRSCNNPTPQYDGLACVGNATTNRFCNEKPCPRTWNETCMTDSNCTEQLICNDVFNRCHCRLKTDVWDQVQMRCLSSSEFIAIYSPERLDFTSATKYCTNKTTGFLATRDFMNNMFLTCMDPNHDIWLASTTVTKDDGETGEAGTCRAGGINLTTELLVTIVNCRENRNFVCVVNRTHLPLVSNETNCSGFIRAHPNTESGDIPLGIIVAAVVIGVMVVLVTAVVICVLRYKRSKGVNTNGSTNTNLEVTYNNNTDHPVADPKTPDPMPREEAGPVIETDHYGYGILDTTSGTDRNDTGNDNEDLYSHTKSNQPFGSDYDVFVTKTENKDESGIYDHTGPGLMDEGEYDEFQDPKSSCVNSDDFIYNTTSDEYP